MRALAGSSVLVTGGGSGIGAGVARHFVALGARVTVSGRRAEKGAAVADDLGAGCLAVPADVTVAADRQRLLDRALEHGGGLDTLVNAAGNISRGGLETLDERERLALYQRNR